MVDRRLRIKILIGAFAILVAGVSLWSELPRQDESTPQGSTADDAGDRPREMSFSNVEVFRISSSSIPVRLRAGDGPPSAAIHGPDTLWLTGSQTGGIAEVEVSGGATPGPNVRLDIFVSVPIVVEVDAPFGGVDAEGVAISSLTAESASGDITVRDVTADLRLETSSGSITAVDIAVPGAAGADDPAEDGSGDLFGDGAIGSVGGGGVRVASSSGAIVLTRVQRLELADTASGSITGTEIVAGESMEIDSASGSIDLQLAHSPAELTLTVGRSRGAVRINGEEFADEVAIGSGSVAVTVDSAFGDITIDTRP